MDAIKMPQGLPEAQVFQIILGKRFGKMHDGVMAIMRGDKVEARTASDELVRMRALGAPVQGRDFPVIWVCTEQEWERATAEDDDPDGLPWPMSAISELADA